MFVRKEDSPVEPAYPDAREFLKNRVALGAALLGAGMTLGACSDKGRTSGVPMRTGGVVAVPDSVKEPVAEEPKTCEKGKNDQPVRLGGDIAVEPKSDPPRLPGKPKIEPPRVPGAPPPMVPTNPEP